MTKGQALQEWFSQFLTAYSTSSVPDDAVFPWLTYELITGAWDSGEIGLTVNLWYYTEKEAEPNAKAQEISDAIFRRLTLRTSGLLVIIPTRTVRQTVVSLLFAL